MGGLRCYCIGDKDFFVEVAPSDLDDGGCGRDWNGVFCGKRCARY